ncbi:MAG: type II toxin-antitoxin system RelE/ParE family toxin [Magnetovibrionaceae bacterium]
MPQLERSALFKRQLIDITTSYRQRAGSPVALRFVDQVNEAISFLSANPFACAIYTRLEGEAFRKWPVGNFPVSVFFRLKGHDRIILEALYAHRMNISGRLPYETGEH